MLIIVMVLVHVIFLPYKKRIHNIIDVLLFANLGLISCLKLMMVTVTEFSSTSVIHFVHILEIILVNLPIAVATVYVVYQGVLKGYERYKRKYFKTEGDNRDSFLLDNIREEQLGDYHQISS